MCLTVCGRKPAEIVFVLDESGSIWGPDFDKQIDFVKEVVNDFDVSETMTHIGTMTFASDPVVHLQLTDLYEKSDILAALDKVGHSRGFVSNSASCLTLLL